MAATEREWDGSGFRARVQSALDTFIEEQATVLAPLGSDAARLVREAHASVSGGKRFRAAFCYWGHRAVAAEVPWLSLIAVGGSLRFWDAASGAKLWTLPAHKSAVIGVHLDGVDIVTRGFAGEIARWRLPRSGAVMEACAHHPPCALMP